jgi:hypothetical protein
LRDFRKRSAESPIPPDAQATSVRSQVVVAIGGKRLIESGLSRTFAPKPQASST